MKKLIYLSFLFFLFHIQAYGLEVSIDAASFKNDGKTYLETYIRVIGNTLQFNEVTNANGQLQAGVELTMIIRQGENIVSFEKFTLRSPLTDDVQDFLDVKRFALAAGAYILKLEAVDINDPDNKLELEKRVEVSSYADDINLSDVQLFASVKACDLNNPLAKNGLLMEPLTYGFVSSDIDILNIYTEIYKVPEVAGPHFVKYAIVDGYSNGAGNTSMKKYKKLSDKTNEPLLLQLPVDKLPSGKYHVEIEVFDKDKLPIQNRKVDFIRSNPEYDIEYWKNYNEEEGHSFVSDLSSEELNYALRAISPIVYEPKKSLMNFMIKQAPIRAQRKFLLDFWTDASPDSPELAYYQYMKVAKTIDIEFNNNVGYGFETDRGYIFLRYGKPNNALSIDTEPDSFPYEIWYYDYLKETNQLNVRFIFYNRSLVHNDYKLLHSTCIREMQNPQWEIELYRRALDVQELNAIDARTVQDNWQRNARRYFNDF